jgi:F-type H+-transporting ATPase subunit delta
VRGGAVARNYAEALFALGTRTGEAQVLANAFAVFERVVEAEPRVRAFLDTPKVDMAAKKQVLRRALTGRVPATFLNFLLVAVGRGRQRLIPAMAREYRLLLDEHLGVLHATVTLAHAADAATERRLTAELSRILRRKVIPRIEVDRSILGGVVVRFGDRMLDGSLRRRMMNLRSRLLHAGMQPTA